MVNVKIPVHKDSRKKHYAWRAKVAKHLPKLASRVFALRGKMYSGYGCHYDIERRLGKVISFVNDRNNRLDFTEIMIDEILFEELLRDIIRAEFSAKGWNFYRDEKRPERFCDPATLVEISWEEWKKLGRGCENV